MSVPDLHPKRTAATRGRAATRPRNRRDVRGDDAPQAGRAVRNGPVVRL